MTSRSGQTDLRSMIISRFRRWMAVIVSCRGLASIFSSRSAIVSPKFSSTTKYWPTMASISA
ncbi:MAG: hypothetical protein ABSA97_11020 [Verrucomicrobiia bacterium]